MKGNFAGPLIMKDEIWAAIRKDEIRAAIRKMKLGKVTCSDSISVELKRSQNYLMKTQIPPDISKSIFIALQRNQGKQTVNCTEQSVL